MKKIFKFNLSMVDSQEISMPIGAKILCVQTKENFGCLWAICDVDAPYENRTFKTYGTGNPLPENIEKYIGTYQTNNFFVWHVFEI